jgi:hypothetical protein
MISLNMLHPDYLKMKEVLSNVGLAFICLPIKETVIAIDNEKRLHTHLDLLVYIEETKGGYGDNV